jgi:phosphate transport system substrate-binding protein
MKLRLPSCWRRLVTLASILGTFGTANAKTSAVDPSIPAYAPAGPASGEIVCWGDDAFADLMQSWAKEFTALHPAVSFHLFLKGTSTAVGALYTGTAQIGCFGREIRPLEIVSWRRIFSYDPLGFSVATGGYDQYNKTNAVAILVNKDNPLNQISLRQLDAIYSRDRRRGGKEPITTWGQLGLTGDWAGRPIHVYGLDENTGTAQFLQFRILREGRWQYDIKLPKGAPDKMYAGSGNDASAALVKAVAADRYAIGLATFRNLAPSNKALAIGEEDGGPFVAGTEETVVDRTYPLSRLVYIFVNKDPAQPWDPKVREFLSFILSREGQAAVAAEGAYHPLPAAMVAKERTKLD